jgi:hypothetical protein
MKSVQYIFSPVRCKQYYVEGDLGAFHRGRRIMYNLQNRLLCTSYFHFVLFEKCTVYTGINHRNSVLCMHVFCCVERTCWSKCGQKKTLKAPGKKRVPRMQSAKREEDLAKRINRRNTQKKTFVSKTIALEQDKLAMALVPVQLDNEGTAMQSMMLRRRKATQDMVKMMDKKRKAVLSNDLIKLN